MGEPRISNNQNISVEHEDQGKSRTALGTGAQYRRGDLVKKMSWKQTDRWGKPGEHSQRAH